jgi:hypothetical protein
VQPPQHELYETLGVPRTASAEEIRRACFKLARKYHPDLNPGNKAAEDLFKNVQEAYDILSDSKARRTYDQAGVRSQGGAGPQPAPKFDWFEHTERWRDGNWSQRDFYVPGFGEKRAPSVSDVLKDPLLSFLADAAIGLVTMAVAVFVALLYGGFSFYEPWLFALPIPHFVAGLLFGYGPRNCWTKAACINFFYFLYVGYIIVTLGPQWKTMWPDLALVYPPTVLGVYLHHLVRRMTKRFAAGTMRD